MDYSGRRAHDSKAARDKEIGSTDLGERWNSHLRRAAKSSSTIACPICPDRKIQRNEDGLRDHVLRLHPEHLPPEKDSPEFEKVLESIISKAMAPIKSRPSRDDTQTRPYEDLSPFEMEIQSPVYATCDEAPADSAAIMAQAVQGIQDVPPGTPTDRRSTTSRTRKKRVLGLGKSPSSSVAAGSIRSRTPAAEMPSKNRTATSDAEDGHVPSRAIDVQDKLTRPPATGKRLYEPENDTTVPGQSSPSTTVQRSRGSPYQHKKNPASTQSSGRQGAPKSQTGMGPGTIPVSILSTNPSNQQGNPTSSPESLEIVRQPETRPISQAQLVAEVKGIYAGLVMVEGKCIQVDAKQAALAREAAPGAHKLNNEQWQALIALHRTLLHEHHDFFLASQHPSATPAVRRLAVKYAMPARLWRHGIHSFLELLRNRLPDSLDHMLAFIYLAYSMMTLLYETVPAFEETWIECLGDLGRYRMAIEDDDIRDRETWTQVARQWYLKASDRAPRTGRLYHHLAILARPNALQQLFFYSKALSVTQPFVAARESVLTLFEPILTGKQVRRLPPVINTFVKVHAIIFMGENPEAFPAALNEFTSLLDSHISRVTQRFLEQGYYVGISNCLALLSFGASEGPLALALAESDDVGSSDTHMGGTAIAPSSADKFMFKEARQLFVQTIEINCARVGDPNVLSFLHVTLVFMVYVSRSASAMKLLENEFPWASLVTMLNTLLRFYHTYERIESEQVPIPMKNDFRPTPEEFALRGLVYASYYFLSGWFANKNIEDENQYKEDASMNTEYRPERILWLACQLAKPGYWITYNQAEHKFAVPGMVSLGDVAMTPSAASEADSGIESVTDSATMMGDYEDDLGSRKTSEFSPEASEEEIPQSRPKRATRQYQATVEEDDMEMDYGSVVTAKDANMGDT